ncbi:Aspartate/glutamate leucyltransferase [Brevundimonas sp. NIBR10]|uniref:arginyltransferase n=1 Tax=Brevundimonas sp. NIBR10 TaxID=3015997 RepID=UPI0022F17AFD|nr:arginyltransferase [Brevundimonas sp. NIBR10]WGM47050.1 Aspartate/glutamate leucyltransferase [Brevundimonas sp. NIBR10]
MTQFVPTRQLRFFMTAIAPCPYLPGMTERKVFANLPFSDGAHVNDELTHAGFRRSQNIAYRPACEGCDACISVRLPVPEFAPTRTQRKIISRNADLSRDLVEAEATMEQFVLLKRYLATRHPGGGMTDMTWADYVAMVEDTAVRTHLIEYRLPSTDGGPGDLVAVSLTDLLSDGLSMVYSFFDPALEKRSLGVFAILDHIRQAAAVTLPFVYLGYWVEGSTKMDYKAGFRPMEVLKPLGWTRLDV